MFDRLVAEPGTFRETLTPYGGLRMIADGVSQVAAGRAILQAQSQTAADCLTHLRRRLTNVCRTTRPLYQLWN